MFIVGDDVARVGVKEILVGTFVGMVVGRFVGLVEGT